jgi:nucleoid-associated protein YgaU
MKNTDISNTRKPHVHMRVSLRTPLRCGFAILVCSCLFAGAAQCRARASQDVAEAARQERARKDQSNKQKHVYTDEDLRREKILTPEDAASIEARRKQQVAPSQEQTVAPLDANAELPQLPLGDVARRYRNAKRAAQTPDTFHLPFDEPVLATPAVSVPELAPPHPNFSPAHPNLVPARPKAIVAPAIRNPRALRRLDPFTRRAAPSAPSSVYRIAPSAPQPSVAPAVDPSKPKSKAVGPAASPSIVAKAPGALKTAIVQPGDSLWKLAQQTLGRGTRWHDLLAANPSVDPSRLQPGTTLVIPAKVATLKSPKSDETVTVEKGATLSKIAKAHYGRAAAWGCIAEANPQIADANRIYEGQQLLLPFRCKP